MLLSRLDLIFLMLDSHDEAFDSLLVHHLVALYYQSKEQVEKGFTHVTVLKNSIVYAHSTVMSWLSQQAKQALIQVYVNLRKIRSSVVTEEWFLHTLDSWNP